MRPARHRPRRSAETGRAFTNPEQKNYAEIERLERLLDELRASASTARETEAIQVSTHWDKVSRAMRRAE